MVRNTIEDSLPVKVVRAFQQPTKVQLYLPILVIWIRRASVILVVGLKKVSYM